MPMGMTGTMKQYRLVLTPGSANWLMKVLLQFKLCLGIINLGAVLLEVKAAVTMDGFSLKSVKTD